MELTGRQRRHLRSLGHHLDPVVMIGREGVSEAVERKTHLELEAHELIKVRAGDGSAEPIADVAARLAEKTGAVVAGVIGRTALLYRRRKKDPEIVLPRG